MADDISNNRDETSNVSSATPLETGSGSTPVSDQAQSTSGESTPMSPSSGASSANMAAQQTNTTNKSAPKASSGMFTNIQKYVNKNKPQAQKMSKAVQASTGEQAAEIRQAADQKQAQTNQALTANNQAIDKEKQFAQQQVQNIMGNNTPAPVAAPQEGAAVPAPVAAPVTSQADIDRFQSAMKGDVQGLQDVQATNLAQKQNKAQALKNLAQNARTEQGRKNLLKDTFGTEGQTYNRGMSGLDQAILGGDQAAKTDLIQGIQGQSDQLQQDLTGSQATQQDMINAQKAALQNIGADVTEMGTQAETGLTTDMQTAYDDAIAERQALLNPESAEYLAATAGSQAELDRMNNIVGNRTSYANMLEKGMSKLARRNRTLMKNSVLNPGKNYFERMRDFDKMEKGTEAYKNAKEGLANAAGARVTHGKHRTGIDKLMKHANKNIIGDLDTDLYNLKGVQETASGSDNNMRRRFGGAYDFYNDQIAGLGSADDIVQNRLAKEGGIDYSQLTAGEDIGQYDTASEDQINKVNALRNLMGNQNVITDEQMGDREYTSADSLRNILARYKK